MSGSTTRSESGTSPSTGSGSTSESPSGSATRSADDTAGPGSGSTSSPELPPGIDPGFLVEPDLSDPDACNQWAQNCPPGEKCGLWASDGSNSWSGLRCSPVVPNPDRPGEPCTVEGSVGSGIDSCDAHSMCFDVDENLEGVCYARCVGSEYAPICNRPDEVCPLAGDGLLALCRPTCDPLLGDCAVGQSCVPYDTSFFCVPDASGPDTGASGDPCEYENACDPGLVCIDATQVVTCASDTPRCCTPICDWSADNCPSPLSCRPWFEPPAAPPGYENVGVCVEPQPR